MTLLRGALLPDGTTADVRLAGGLVTEVAGALPSHDGEPVTDLDGRLLLGAFAEPHVHLDKAFTASRAANASGDLAGAMRGYSGVAAAPDPADIRGRALTALRSFLASGVTAVRCQTGCGPLSGVTAVRALAALRDEVAHSVDLQVVAHAAVPDGDAAAHRALLREAVAAGADLIGGNPFMEADPHTALRTCFEVAAEHGLGLDLHVDETLDTSALTLPDVARLAAEHPLPVTAGHCVALGRLPRREALDVAALVSAAGVGVVTLPATNLYLQGRGDDRRGLTAIGALRERGVTVAAGADNVRDPFNPTGRCDPLETAALLVTAGHQDVAAAAEMVGANARSLLGLPVAGPVPGAVADLVALRALSVADAVAGAPADRIVWRRGREVARTEVSTVAAI
ncbi:amidohydrolase family protein [Spongiactinospora sp. TRM90649]|uniref:amidohydrolase family protein n=1 Tax=Spongiactinospora sp. TRM90649 TaxID=3031114 RepID=UPI0023F9CACD|nr:amidohydrolase family protein [Spongiactinospora sp. TRM90649]MDF5758317.1 amidohydrolase family protein [Spongiactinospora sp. TRM90649]